MKKVLCYIAFTALSCIIYGLIGYVCGGISSAINIISIVLILALLVASSFSLDE